MNDAALPWRARYPFDHLWSCPEGGRAGGYDLIMADPAWSYKARSAKGLKKSAQTKYNCMSLAEIAALPVADLAARNCVLWLWATNPMLPMQLEVAKAWGFKYSTSGVWVKTTKRGKLAFGTGHVLRGASEPFLICTRGAPKFAKNVRSAFLGERREHSRKPEEAYEHAMRLVPGAQRRADLFARQVRPGWDGWGDQVDRFTQEELAA